MADEATTTTDAAGESTADSANDTSTATAAATEAKANEGEAALGDAGKKALDAMKAERNAAKAELAAFRKEFEEFKAKAEGREAEHAAAVEAQRVKDEALAAANERIVKAEVRAAAAGKLADPQDALRFLNLSEFEVGKDGEVDTDAVSAAIEDLIKTKPYLAAQGKRFQGDADGGARKEHAGVQQITEAELASMTPEQIETARKEGRLNKLLGIGT